MSESRFMRSTNGFRCANCFHYSLAPTGHEVTKTVPYCGRRERMIGYNPLLFMCGDYASRCEPRPIQTSLDWRWRYEVLRSPGTP